ncbi:hypothetical protein N0V82_004627 [Gnomoniopsis sp. IMI 355080]|nr:hypothetical protein N0V82_004627 [Gnomoniopsis sp. IMI 355080]
MASHNRRSSINDCNARKHSRQLRHSRDNHATNDTARRSCNQYGRGITHQSADRTDSESSDEILIKGRASRRFRHNDDKDVARATKSIDKRGSLRPSSSSSQEIEVRYVSVVSKSSGSDPSSKTRQSSPSSSESAGISASDITSQLKHIKSWLGRRTDDSHKSSQRSRSRSKHEKRDKHGKKRVSASKFLAPLAQRWVCYKCGKLRSDTIQQRHPLQEGQKMQPNWCGKCRVRSELHDRELIFNGQGHYCWGCGIVRSKDYHIDNPIDDHEKSTPNYCRPCRKMSPAFDYNLREASEISSVADVREKAFCRQMQEADLSDIIEEGDGQSSSAPGKENQNPESRKLKVSKSFMLENCSSTVRTTSGSSAEGDVPLDVLKAQLLVEERARSTNGGGCRLSDGSYQSPTVESDLIEQCVPGLKTTNVTSEALSFIDGSSDYDTKTSDQSIVDGGSTSNPVVMLASKQQGGSDGATKKRVHWIKQPTQPMTADSNASDSAYCSGYPSDISYKSAGSRRSRLDPRHVSNGSPPIQGDEGSKGDLKQGNSKQASFQRPESRGKGRYLPVHETFGVPAHEVDADAASYRRDSTQSSHSIPPSPQESFEPVNTCSKIFTGQNGYESPVTPWVESPEISNFSRPYLSPPKQHTQVSPNFSRPFLSPPKQHATAPQNFDPDFGTSFGTRTGFMPESNPYESAAHFSDWTQGRNHSGHDAPGEARASIPHERYGPSVQRGDCPPAGCPIYNDYGTYTGCFGGAYAEEDYGGTYSSFYGDNATFPSSNGHTPFDFSGFGGTSSSNANRGDGSAPEGEKFVRSKKKTNQSTPRQQSYHLYDDGEDDGSAAYPGTYKWRKDGRTTVHRSGGGKVPNEGNTVKILSIREINSDEELAIHEDYDEASELDTVIGDNSINDMKSICAA